MDSNTHFVQIVDPNEKPVKYTITVAHSNVKIDANGYAYIDLNGNRIRYEYADTITERDDADDTGRQDHAAGEGDTDAEHAANNG